MKRYLQFWLVNLSVSLILIAGMALTWISKGIGLFLLALSLGLGGYWLFAFGNGKLLLRPCTNLS